MLILGTAAVMLCDTVGDEARAGVESRVDTGTGAAAAALEGWTGDRDAMRLDSIDDRAQVGRNEVG